MSFAESRRASGTAAAMRERIQKANCRPPGSGSKERAMVLPFPAKAQRGFIDNELRSVRSYDDFAAHKWLTRVVRRHRTKLQKLNISPDRIEADVAALVEAFGIGEVAAPPRLNCELPSSLGGLSDAS